MCQCSKRRNKTRAKEEDKGDFENNSEEVKRFSGTKVIPEQMSFQEEVEPGCGGRGYRT